ncbi:MAG: hypothetical protein QXV32_02255 [Conexivisphaerales archaeon]
MVKKIKHSVREEILNAMFGIKDAHYRKADGRFDEDPFKRINDLVLGKKLKK